MRRGCQRRARDRDAITCSLSSTVGTYHVQAGTMVKIQRKRSLEGRLLVWVSWLLLGKHHLSTSMELQLTLSQYGLPVLCMNLTLGPRSPCDASLFSLRPVAIFGFGYSFLSPSDTTTFLHLVSIYVRVMAGCEDVVVLTSPCFITALRNQHLHGLLFHLPSSPTFARRRRPEHHTQSRMSRYFNSQHHFP